MIRFLRHLFLHDFWLKLFSLGLALLTWFTINFALNRTASPRVPLGLVAAEERVFPNLPVEVLSSAEDVRSVRVVPKEVTLTVRGNAGTLREVQVRDLRVLVDLTGIEAAQGLRKRLEVSTPPGVTYERVEPQEVQVIFPPKAEIH